MASSRPMRLSVSQQDSHWLVRYRLDLLVRWGAVGGVFYRPLPSDGANVGGDRIMQQRNTWLYGAEVWLRCMLVFVVWAAKIIQGWEELPTSIGDTADCAFRHLLVICGSDFPIMCEAAKVQVWPDCSHSTIHNNTWTDSQKPWHMLHCPYPLSLPHTLSSFCTWGRTLDYLNMFCRKLDRNRRGIEYICHISGQLSVLGF
jgi:hypothetical protein